MGRPYYMADIDMANDPVMEWYDDFCDALDQLTYPDMRAVARTLGITRKTMQNWKEGRTFPAKMQVALMIVRWVNAGKPRKLVTQSQAAAGMM